MSGLTPTGGLIAKVGGQKNAAMIGGVLVVGAVFLGRRKHAKAQSAGTAANPVNIMAQGYADTAQDPTAVYSGYDQLQQQIDNIQKNANATGTANPNPAPLPTSGGSTTPPAPVPVPPAPLPSAAAKAPDPNEHYTSDGKISLATLARWNNSTPDKILAATQASEPSDVKNYLSRGVNAVLPSGTKWNIPRN